jgi:argininosuccinate lyase
MAATDIADYLVKKGMPFRTAHEVSGRITLYCIQNNTTFDNLKIEEYKKYSDLFDKNIYKAIDLKTLVEKRNIISGPNANKVKEEIKNLETSLKSI